MLKKLQLKFIIINMTIVTIMMCLIFGLLYTSTRSNLEKESIQMMNGIGTNPMSIISPNGRPGDIRLPYFSIMVNNKGEAIQIGGGFFDLSDTELLEKILQDTYNTQAQTGILEEYNLRFSTMDTRMGRWYIYVDITNELVTLRNLVKTFIAIGIAAFLGFLAISILLAKWAIKPVKDAWDQQKQFVADASHELKTPLTVIMTDAELINTTDCSDTERVQLSDSIIAMSKQMRGLVESLLELARIDAGNVKGVQTQVSFTDITQEAAMMFEPVFFEKNLTFNYQVEPNLTINGNESQLKQLVSIFLDNAAKYSTEGATTTLTLKKLSNKKCQLRVANEGNPISQDELKNLFKRFYRADKARQTTGSYGLGLSIAESITEAHHGKIWAESKDGLNIFTVELPM